MNSDIDRLECLSREIRRSIFQMIYQAGGGHIAPAFSIVEILTVLYFGGVLKYDARQPKWEERDRFILSKGHAAAALYPVLARAGYINEELLNTFCQKGSILGGHPDMRKIPGVEASTGSLGHGLSFGIGIALAAKLNAKDYHAYVLLGDGECQEGSIWEAALFATQQKLNNLTVIIDYNKLQAMERLDQIIGIEPLGEKWQAFGWNVVEVDGHDIKALQTLFNKKPAQAGQPRLVIAHTIKGKGVSFMESQPLWHYRMPDDQELQVLISELGIKEEENNSRLSLPDKSDSGMKNVPVSEGGIQK
ncbi:MAG: transketolase [Bacillota bacterium]|nr:transketolase [Bacillota bacterium]